MEWSHRFWNSGLRVKAQCADTATDGKTMGNAGRVEVSLSGTIGGSCRAPAGPFPQRVVLLLGLTKGLALFLAEEQTLPEAV